MAFQLREGEKRGLWEMDHISLRKKECGARTLFLVQAPAESRSKGRNSALRGTWRGKCPQGPDGCLRWSPPGQGEGTLACAQARMCTMGTPARLSAEESRRDQFTTSLFSISVCCLSHDVHWTPKGAGSSLRAGQTSGWRNKPCGHKEPQRAEL